jgi:2-polyprenyl-3-methyl-5-hydroxy-6-metoxy-1,4-benzoquinol methylase
MGEIFLREASDKALDFTGERMTAGHVGQVEFEHLHRYFFAREFCRDKDVLDVAAGEGYGSAYLGQIARSVVGVELSAKAVEHANASYKRDNVSFHQGDARHLTLPDASFDVVTSFETIEHFLLKKIS